MHFFLLELKQQKGINLLADLKLADEKQKFNY